MIRAPKTSVVVLIGLVSPALGRTLEVGPGLPLAAPSAAAAMARDGDTIAIAPGTYYDCATWRANGLTIQGIGPGVVITDTTCAGKALFITVGQDITIRGLTFARARVADRNGAGIRAEGRDLTVEDSRFEDDQEALLAADSPDSEIRLVRTVFAGNGAPAAEDGRPATDAMATGRIAALLIDDCRFEQPRGGTHLLTHAARTEIRDSRFTGGSIGVVAPDGGALVLERDRFEGLGWAGALVLADGGRAAGPLRFAHNTYAGAPGTPFVRNLSGQDATLEANTASGTEHDTAGTTRHRLGNWLHHLAEALRRFAGAAKHRLAALLHAFA